MAATGVTPPALSVGMLSYAGGFWAALLAGDRYRQRFFLDPPRERGMHWRAGVLQFAKWPQLVGALYEVVVDLHLPYATTSKRRSISRPAFLLWPNLAAGGGVALAWLVGRTFGAPGHPVVDASVGLVVTAAILLAAAGLRRFPDPYEPSLLDISDMD